MKPERNEPALDLGIYGRQPSRPRATATDIAAGVLTAVWLVVAAVFLFGRDVGEPADPGNFVLTLVAIFLPVAMIWVAASVAKTARIMREEAQRLQAAIDAMRHAYISQQHGAGAGLKPSVEKTLAEIAASQKQTETVIATFATRREAAAETPSTEKLALPREEPPAADTQPALALAEPEPEAGPPISVAEFIRAVNFPENEDDTEGFRTLRNALADRDIARLIRAAQDVLTLLSQDGIYMDDLRPDRSGAEVWRAFARGRRGREVAALAGIRDRSCLALAAGRLRKDPVFRDAVHHFLRHFDRVFAKFEASASDNEIVAFSETRTARAFMLLGRVAGTFD